VPYCQNNNVVTSTSPAVDKNDGTWIVRRGVANNACVSFESRDFPGDFLRHFNFQLLRQPNDGTAVFRADATFCPQAGLSGQGTSFASFNFPTRFIRHFNNTVFIASNAGRTRSTRPPRGGGRELGRQLALDAVAELETLGVHIVADSPHAAGKSGEIDLKVAVGGEGTADEESGKRRRLRIGARIGIRPLVT
jgi:hypothetical protein